MQKILLVFLLCTTWIGLQAQNQIVQYEYWFDSNPGAAIVNTISPNASILLSTAIPTVNLSEGIHSLHIRFRDNIGQHSSVVSQYFYKPDSLARKIIAYRYWFNEFDVLTKTVRLTTPVTPLELLAQIEASPLNVGQHRVHLQFQDVAKQWSSVVTDTFQYAGVSNTNIHPHITLSLGFISVGQNIDITGSYFSANQPVELLISGPKNYSESITSVANSQGLFNHSYSTTGLIPGTYDVLAVDSTANKYAPLRAFTVADVPVFTTTVVITAPDSETSLHAGEPIRVNWTDILKEGNVYPQTISQRHYSYELSYSDDGGQSWQVLTTVSGMDYVGREISLSEEITLINPGTNYKLKVTDTFVPSNFDETDVLTINPALTSNVQVDLVWDYSYPDRSGRLLGVAADGISRIYLKVSKKNPAIGPNIASVLGSLQDGSVNTTSEKLGKIMPASEIDMYSIEANAAIQTTANSANLVNGEVWFWYVAPDDFVGEATDDENASSRIVNVDFTINYSDNSSASISQQINVVRPPLMLVHGLGGSPATWDEFGRPNRPFRFDPRFLVRKRAKLPDPGGRFEFNSFLLLGTEGENATGFEHSFPGIIKALRDKGYAANQVDYVSHSMGGVILRYAQEFQEDYFERIGAASGRKFKNYEQGYVHKTITIGTPHNSSPLADMAARYSDDLPLELRGSIHIFFGQNPNSFIFSLIRQKNPNAFIPVWEITDAVRDLQIDGTKGGVDFGTLTAKAHLIASDILPLRPAGLPNTIPQEVIDEITRAQEQFDFLGWFIKVALDRETDQQFAEDLTEVFRIERNPVHRGLKFLELFVDAFNFGAFVGDSDVIVSVESQLSGLPRSASNVSVVGKRYHAIVPKREVNSDEIGDIVNTLLNSSISGPNPYGVPGPFFSNLPASSNKHENSLDPLGPSSLVARRDTNILLIRSPISGMIANVNHIINVQFALKDTVNLLSLEINFQNKTYILSERTPLINFSTQVNGNRIDDQILKVEAFYFDGDSSRLILDEVKINVLSSSNLVALQADPAIIYLYNEEMVFPKYIAYFQDFTTGKANFSPDITANIENPSIVSFDTLTKGFTGLSDGETFAIVSYRNRSDTIYFVVEGQLDSTITSIHDPYDFDNVASDFFLNYPNPFSEITQVEYETKKPGEVLLEVFSIDGVKVHQAQEPIATPGRHTKQFDGSRLSPGIYPFRLTTPSQIYHGKFVIIR